MSYALHICCILSTVVDSQQTCNKCCKLAICENRWEKWKKKPPQILEIYIQYLKRELDLLKRVALQCAVLKRKQRSENPPPLLEKLKGFFLFLINIAMLPKNNTPFRQKKIFFGSPPIYEKICLNYFWSLNSFRTCVNQTYGLLPAHTNKLTIVEVLRVLQWSELTAFTMAW